MRINNPFGLILGVPANVNTNFIYGSGVGGLNTSVRLSQKKRASFSCCSKTFTTTPQIPILISCFYDNASTTPFSPNIPYTPLPLSPGTGPVPIGFDWCSILLSQFPNKYDITLMLHGTNLKYGLDNNSYNTATTTINGNPFAPMLNYFMSKGVKIKICDYCLQSKGWIPLNNYNLLPGVDGIVFAVDYIAEYQLTQNKNAFTAVVVYDATLNFFPTTLPP